MVNPHRVLSDVIRPHYAFWFRNGTIARNIYELVSTLEASSPEVFEYHVNSEKNDFYKWILNILGDDLLAKRLKKERDQKKYIRKIKHRIEELENL